MIDFRHFTGQALDSVLQTPTFVVLKDGNKVGEFVGADEIRLKVRLHPMYIIL